MKVTVFQEGYQFSEKKTTDEANRITRAKLHIQGQEGPVPSAYSFFETTAAPPHKVHTHIYTPTEPHTHTQPTHIPTRAQTQTQP